MSEINKELKGQSSPYLKKIAEGGNREVWTRCGVESPTVIKTQPLGEIFQPTASDPQKIREEHNQFCEKFAEGQKITKDCLGDSYVAARFPKVVPKGKNYIFVTHEKKRTDLYPSEKHPNVTNLCFLGYFGLNKGNGAFDDKNKSFVMGSLGDKNPNYPEPLKLNFVLILSQEIG